MPRTNWKDIDKETFVAYYKANGLAATMERFAISKSTVNTMARLYNVRVDKEVTLMLRIDALRKKTTSTPEIDAVLAEKYLEVAVRPLAKLIGRSHTFVRIRLRQLGLVIPDELIAQRKESQLIKKGSTPPNKGKKLADVLSPDKLEKVLASAFKKGNVPHNTLTDNTITTRRDFKYRGGAEYKWIRIKQGKWEMLHLHTWVKHNGPIPAGYCIRFKDGNTLNCDITNLEMITKAENMLRNQAVRVAKTDNPIRVKKVKERKPKQRTAKQLEKQAKRERIQQRIAALQATKAISKPVKVKPLKKPTARELEAALKRAEKQAIRNQRERKWAHEFMKKEKVFITRHQADKPCRIDERTTIYIYDNQDPVEERRKYLEMLAKRIA